MYKEQTMPLFTTSVIAQFKPRSTDLRSWEHSTSLATRLQDGKSGVRFPGEVRDFSLLQNIQPVFDPTCLMCNGYWGSSLEGKPAGCNVDHSPLI
jgi:hypothetical protein